VDAIDSHACSLEESMRVTNNIPIGCPSPLTVTTVNSGRTLKVNTWPIIGGEAERFQGHHDRPNTITSESWLKFWAPVFIMAGPIGLQHFIRPKDAMLRLFLFWVIVCSFLMMAAHRCTVRVFRQKFTLEDAIGSHACSLEANTRVTNGIPLGSSLLSPVDTLNCVQTLKGRTKFRSDSPSL
jgi:hypothetical protein